MAMAATVWHIDKLAWLSIAVLPKSDIMSIRLRMTRQRFKILLTELGWTHAKAAHELGLSTRTVSRYAASKTIPRVIELALKYFLIKNGCRHSSQSS
jgi:DNA-binding XRE family transcriptional regulator